MNTLTVNLHLLLASFYRPTAERFRILIEDTAFPSDSYAVQSQAAWHGLDPADAVVRVPIDGVGEAIERLGVSLAVVLLPGVNYLSGEVLDVAGLTEAVHAVGAVAAWDLAHSIGNVPVSLHDADADFAVWCHYKYVNGGPGAPGGAFVHERHGRDLELTRLAGWWGNDPEDALQDGARASCRGPGPRAGRSRRRRCSRSRRSARRSSSSTASALTRCAAGRSGSPRTWRSSSTRLRRCGR